MKSLVIVAATSCMVMSAGAEALAKPSFAGMYKSKDVTLELVDGVDDNYNVARTQILGMDRRVESDTGVAIPLGGNLWISMRTQVDSKSPCPLFVYTIRGSQAKGKWIGIGGEGLGSEQVTKLSFPRRKAQTTKSRIVGEDGMGTKYPSGWTIKRGDGKNTYLIDRTAAWPFAKDRTYGAYRLGNQLGMTDSSCRLIVYRRKGRKLVGVRVAVEETMNDDGSTSANHWDETLTRSAVRATPGPVFRSGGINVQMPTGWKPKAKSNQFESPAMLGGYHDNISVTVIPAVQLTPPVRKALQQTIVGEFKKLFPSYKMTSSSVAKFGKHMSFRILGNLVLNRHRVILDQVVIATPRAGVMIGCAYLATRKPTTGAQCEAVFGSVR